MSTCSLSMWLVILRVCMECGFSEGAPQDQMLFVSWGWHNKFPQTKWLKTIEISSLTALEARSPKSNCCGEQGTMLPLKPLGKNPFLPLPNFWWLLAMLGIPWLVAPSIAFVFTWLSSLCVCVSPNISLHLRVSVIAFRVHTNPV